MKLHLWKPIFVGYLLFSPERVSSSHNSIILMELAYSYLFIDLVCFYGTSQGDENLEIISRQEARLSFCVVFLQRPSQLPDFSGMEGLGRYFGIQYAKQ